MDDEKVLKPDFLNEFTFNRDNELFPLFVHLVLGIEQRAAFLISV
jgi:hypothetical protein